MPVIDPYRLHSLQITALADCTASAIPQEGKTKTTESGKSFELPTYSRILVMTMLNTVPPNVTAAPAIGQGVRVLLKRLGRLLNRWLSAAIAERARQADIALLHHLGDRELKDIGLTRGDLREGLAEAARIRMRKQQAKRS
jgi:hypothetical protein